MSILQIIIIFILFCLAWILTQIIWEAIKGKMIKKRQADLMDLAYAKLVRIALKAAGDLRDLREVMRRDHL